MADGNSGTVPKQLKPFVKGDPRINRKGRPKSFDALRSLAQEIAHEAAKKSKEQGGGPGVYNFDLQATLSNLSVVTLVQGVLNVREDVR